MSRVFAYCRVSTNDQTTNNQILEIGAAGFKVTAQRTIVETVSGSVPASERAGFAQLLNKLEEGDVLVVTKLDRLGRNAMDVRSTVEALTGLGVRVHCLALGGVDLTSAAGKMTMGVLAAVAEFERDLLIERTQAGLSRAKASGTTLGRPQALRDSGRTTKAPRGSFRGVCSPAIQDQSADHYADQGSCPTSSRLILDPLECVASTHIARYAPSPWGKSYGFQSEVPARKFEAILNRKNTDAARLQTLSRAA